MSLVSVTSTLGSLVFSGEGGGVEVDFDLTLLGQVALFILLLVVLKPLLFDPMLKLFEERERRIDGAKVLARKIDEKSAGALATYEQEMQKARAAANLERDKLRAEGQKAENEILARVRATTAKTLEEGRKRMQAEAATAKEALRNDAAATARELATRVLGREVH
jgi:F-type H+-transporting ATPase subunit b